MKIHIYRHEAPDHELLQRLDWLRVSLEVIQANQESIMATIKELVASVAAVKGKADSIAMIISQLREQVAGLIAGNLPADVQADVDKAFADAEAAKNELSTAVDANPGNASASTDAGKAVPAPGVFGTTPGGVAVDAPPPANAPFGHPQPDSFSNATGQAPKPFNPAA